MSTTPLPSPHPSSLNYSNNPHLINPCTSLSLIHLSHWCQNVLKQKKKLLTYSPTYILLWLHWIKSKLRKKEQKVFYEVSCFFSLLSTHTTLPAFQPYQTTSVYSHRLIQLCTPSGMTFPLRLVYPLLILWNSVSSHLEKAFLDFPNIHSPHALTSLCMYLY